jgi:hypothetical protein
VGSQEIFAVLAVGFDERHVLVLHALATRGPHRAQKHRVPITAIY